jgi:hypothetical protein
LKYASIFGVTWCESVIAGVHLLAVAVSAFRLALFGPTIGTTRYCRVSPGFAM